MKTSVKSYTLSHGRAWVLELYLESRQRRFPFVLLSIRRGEHSRSTRNHDMAHLRGCQLKHHSPLDPRSRHHLVNVFDLPIKHQLRACQVVPVYPGHFLGGPSIGIEGVPNDKRRSPEYPVRRTDSVHWLLSFVEESRIEGRVTGKPQCEHRVRSGWIETSPRETQRFIL